MKKSIFKTVFYKNKLTKLDRCDRETIEWIILIIVDSNDSIGLQGEQVSK